MQKNFEANNNKEVYQQLLNFIDLTSLNNTDNTKQIIEFTEKVNKFDQEYPQLKNVAAICVYPNFAGIVRSHLEVDSVNIAVVAGGFPFSQTFTEIKVAETSLAVIDGADEVDIVINLGNFLSGELEEMTDEISEIKDSCRDARLKVILESGQLKTASNIKKASILSIYAGADFIKTSTGKVDPAATLEAAYVMCEAIKEYYDKTGNMIGFKPAGGIVTTADAVKYYSVVKDVLGDKWLDNKYFRLGASRLANNLLSDIMGEDIKFF
jgi:deoxyribose-phosphate aldolase